MSKEQAIELNRLAEEHINRALRENVNSVHPDTILATMEAWQADVEDKLDAIPAVSEADKSRFRIITPFQERGVKGPTPYHVRLLEDALERAERLRAIAAKLETAGD